MPTVTPTRFWSEPYRVLFPLAAAVGAGGAATWTATLAGSGPPTNTAQHGLLLLFGAIGSGIIGFLGTAFPRQNQGARPGRAWVSAVSGTQLSGVALLVAGWWWPGAQSAALVLSAALWAGIAVWAGRIAWPSLGRQSDPTTVLVPLCAAAVAVASGWALFTPRSGLRLALYAGFVPIAFVLLDRMLPFFSRKLPGFDGHRKGGLMPMLVGLIPLRVYGELGPSGGPIDPDLVGNGSLAGLASLGLLVVVLRQAHGWRPLIGLKEPLVAVLHFGWMAFAAGFAADALMPLGITLPGAGLHFHTLGLLTLLFGFGIRVLRGHAGRGLALGADGAVLIGILALVMVGRAVLPLLHITDPLWIWLVPGAGLSLAFALWGLRWGPLAAEASG